jgi:glycosyltransferase involved in cell wall biosynthesis
VSGIHRQLIAAGVECEVLDTTQIPSRFGFAMKVAGYATAGWTLHLHTNGHNRNSWLLALLCGTAGRWRASVLTLHSGMMPAYLGTGSKWRKQLAGLVCRQYSRIICVGPELRDAVVSIGAPIARTEIGPACFTTGSLNAFVAPQLATWIAQHRPVLSTALFFRPEYGFDLLVDAVVQLRRRYPSVGCLVMGSGEQSAPAARLVRQAGLDNDLLLLGDVDHDTCLELISRSDVFLRPTFQDGDSISVREALALGVPVVASRVGSRPPGTILFHPGDVQDMLCKFDLAWAMKRGCRRGAEDSVNHLLELYRQVGVSEEAYETA